MRQLQRLEDLGALAMTLAHDFNNLATVINCSLYVLRERLDNGRSQEDLAAIAEAARASEKLARQLVDFGNAQRLSPRRQTVNAVLERVRPLVERLVGADIQVTVHLENPDVAFRADPDQLDRVFLNLASNARHAMPDGGQLTISGDVYDVPEGLDRNVLPVGDYVAFQVADTGVGMDEQTGDRTPPDCADQDGFRAVRAVLIANRARVDNDWGRRAGARCMAGMAVRLAAPTAAP